MNNDKILQLFKKIIPAPYPYQTNLVTTKDSETIINKSRQVGISYVIAAWAFIRSAFLEKTQLIISPSLRQSKHMMDYIYEHFNRLRDTVDIPLREETKTSLIFTQGGEIHSLPNSANTIRGYRADDIYIDEFAHFTNGTDKQIIEALLPSKSRGGNIRYVSTPFGDQNLFYEYWNDTARYPTLHRMTINYKDCPDFKPEDIEKNRMMLGEDAFQQEFNNQFMSDLEGAEFPMTLIQSCINPELTYTDLLSTNNYYGGADIGREQDLTAFVALEKKNDKYILTYKNIMSQTPYRDQLNFFTYTYDNYHFNNFTIDETGIGNMLVEELHRGRRIKPVTFNNENKQEMVGNLKRLMTENKLEIPDDPQLIASLRAIKRIYTASNYLRFDSVRDSKIGHADLFWALCLALKDENKQHDFVMPISRDW